MSQNRDITFDMMKGIGIILVIIGHLAHGFGWLVPAIYTFHMPLFFILSGYFYKEKKITELLHRDFRSLLVPYLLVTATTIIYGILVGAWQHAPEKTWYWINSFLYAGINNSGIGPLWFLLAMFWCRLLYNLLYKIVKQIPGLTILYMVIISYILFAIISYAHNYMQTINAQCFINGIYAMFYFSLGHLANVLRNKIQILPNYYLLFITIIAAIGIASIIVCMGTSDMSTFRQHIAYNVLASIATTLLLYTLCNNIKALSGRFLSWYGRLSLVVFSLNTVMYRILPIDKIFEIILHTESPYITNSLTVIFHIAITVLLCKVSEKNKVMSYLFYLK